MTEHTHAHKNQMTNTHILVNDFAYFEPASLQEAIDLLVKYEQGAYLIAGGTQLLIQMKMERDTPQALISLKHVPGLDGIEINDREELVIGACAGIHTLRHDPVVMARYLALSQACESFGSSQIEIMATLGGNLCTASPASDTVPALLVFNAELIIVGPQGERRMPAADFTQGPGKVDLRKGEILTHIILPAPPRNSTSAFYKVARVVADLAKASMAILLTREGDRIGVCRLAYGAVAPTVLRLPKVEAMLQGQLLTDDLLAKAGQMAGESISPIDDIRSTAWYRRRIVDVMTQDGVRQLWDAKPAGISNPTADGIAFLTNGKESLSSNGKGSRKNINRGERKAIELIVNGIRRRLEVAPNDLLLNVLREQLHLTGTKYGCGIGECSACSVLIDGKPALSCLMLAVAADGKEVTTIEGLQQPNGELDPLQEAFIAEGAYQCGYCTPGIVMTVKGLLKETGRPSEAELRDYLKGNRCRCTGYTSIVRAVMASLDKTQTGATG